MTSTLETVIRTRRSIYTFAQEPIPDSLIAELLETAIYAPNHRLTEPWRFIILTGDGCRAYAERRRDMALEGMSASRPDARQQVADGVYKKFATIPAYLLVIMSEHGDPEIAEEDYAACSALIQNFLLLAWDRGIGTCWKTFKNHASLRAFLRLEPTEKVVGIVHIGYPAEQPASLRKPLQSRLTVIR